MMSFVSRLRMLVAALGVVACESGRVEEYGVGQPAPPELIAQWDVDVDAHGNGLPAGSGTSARGETLFKQLCARCHGTAGEGTAGAPQLIAPPNGGTRRNIRSHWPYAPPLFGYVRKTMPPDAARPLPADDLYSIIAFLLRENRVDAAAVLDRRALVAVTMPSRDRFVPDDRVGGSVLR